MAAKGKAGGAAPAIERKDPLNPLTREAQAKLELQAQAAFGAKWGSICKDRVPTSLDEAIEMKREQLAALAAKTAREGGAGTVGQGRAPTAQGVYDECAALPNPEAALQGAYKVLRAGI